MRVRKPVALLDRPRRRPQAGRARGVAVRLGGEQHRGAHGRRQRRLEFARLVAAQRLRPERAARSPRRPRPRRAPRRPATYARSGSRACGHRIDAPFDQGLVQRQALAAELPLQRLSGTRAPPPSTPAGTAPATASATASASADGESGRSIHPSPDRRASGHAIGRAWLGTSSPALPHEHPSRPAVAALDHLRAPARHRPAPARRMPRRAAADHHHVHSGPRPVDHDAVR